MKYLALGKTGLMVSEVGFGAIPIIRLDATKAVRVLHRALDHGINFYDTANAYKDSEEKIGQAFAGVRDRVIIATKTGKRDAAGTMRHLENSLRMLRTDYIDLYQLHQVAREEDWQGVLAPGGAVEAMQKAREQGKIRFMGVSSHNQEMAVKMIQTGLFSTIQFPFSFIEDGAKDHLHPVARELGVGIIAMKPFAGGVIDNAPLAFKFLRQYPDAIPIPGYDSVASVDEIVAIYQQPNGITAEDLAAMERYRRDLGARFCRRCEYCQPCPNGVMITLSMTYPLVALRMSPAVAVEFSGKALATVSKCTECGICVEKCPYDLPIPKLLQDHYRLWEQHLLTLP